MDDRNRVPKLYELACMTFLPEVQSVYGNMFSMRDPCVVGLMKQIEYQQTEPGEGGPIDHVVIRSRAPYGDRAWFNPVKWDPYRYRVVYINPSRREFDDPDYNGILYDAIPTRYLGPIDNYYFRVGAWLISYKTREFQISLIKAMQRLSVTELIEQEMQRETDVLATMREVDDMSIGSRRSGSDDALTCCSVCWHNLLEWEGIRRHYLQWPVDLPPRGYRARMYAWSDSINWSPIGWTIWVPHEPVWFGPDTEDESDYLPWLR